MTNAESQVSPQPTVPPTTGPSHDVHSVLQKKNRATANNHNAMDWTRNHDIGHNRVLSGGGFPSHVETESSASLKEVLSPHTFLSHCGTVYRRLLQTALLDLLRHGLTRNPSRNLEGAVPYDWRCSSQCLAAVDWVSILSQHDQQKSLPQTTSSNVPETSLPKRHKEKGGTFSIRKETILTLFLETIQDPGTWPMACYLPLLSTLIQSLLDYRGHADNGKEDPKKRIFDHHHAPACTVVRHFVIHSLRRIPALRRSWEELLPPYCLETSSSGMSLLRIRSRLQLIKEWIHEFPSCHSLLIPHLCYHLLLLDRIEVSSSTEMAATPTALKVRVGEQRGNKTIHCVLGHSKIVDMLHGDMNDADQCSEMELSSTSIVRGGQHFGHTHSSRFPSTKRALQYSMLQKEDNDSLSLHVSRERKTRQIFRSKCLELIFYKSSGEISVSKPASSLSDSRERLVVLFSLLNQITRCGESPSFAYCIVDWVEQCGHGFVSMTDLAMMLWMRRAQHPVFVALYFEVLAECAHFDDIDRLCTALEPFAIMVADAMEQISHYQEIEDERQDQAQTSPSTNTKGGRVTGAPSSVEPIYRYHFAWLLTRRGALLREKEGKTFFPSTVTHLSAMFDQVHDWVPAIKSCQGKVSHKSQAMLEALQQAGVLGLSLNESTQRIHASGCTWPQCLLRKGRMLFEFSCRRQGVLSDISLVNGKPGQSHDCSYIAQLHQTQETCPMNSDVLSHVFSYLGYKRVVWLRGICSDWRAIADNNRLWAELYKSRYPFLPEDRNALQMLENNNCDASNNNEPSWKKLFQDKWAAEREVRSLRGQSNRDYVLCGFVGCNKVLPSIASRRKHHEQHCRRDHSSKKKPTQKKRHRSKEGRSTCSVTIRSKKKARDAFSSRRDDDNTASHQAH